jgi:hypothetical protein
MPRFVRAFGRIAATNAISDVYAMHCEGWGWKHSHLLGRGGGAQQIGMPWPAAILRQAFPGSEPAALARVLFAAQKRRARRRLSGMAFAGVKVGVRLLPSRAGCSQSAIL